MVEAHARLSIVTPFDCTAADWGFAVRDTYAGTLADGTVLRLHEWDYVWTNEEGLIRRWHWFVDSREWFPFLDLIGLDPDGLTYQDYTANFLREGSSPAADTKSSLLRRPG